MVQQEKDKLLHLHTRHTNLSIPYSDYVGYDKFPEQNKDILGKQVQIKYWNIDYYHGSSTDYEDNHKEYIFIAECLVLRCDNVKPFKMILVSLDYRHIFVTDSRKYDTIVTQYPVQLTEYIGVNVKDQYVATLTDIDAVTLRVDEGEPCYSVIMEYIEGDKVRFVLGDECFSKLGEYVNGEQYKYSRLMSEDEIARMRKSLMEGKEILWY
jgi:hypothetical protein